MVKLEHPLQIIDFRPPLTTKTTTMNTLPQITQAQWDQLLTFVGKATSAAAYISRKLALVQWLGVLSALVLGAVIYQGAALKPVTATLVWLALLLPALAVFWTRRRLQELSKAPQAIEQIRIALASLPGSLRDVVQEQKDSALKLKDQGGMLAALQQVRMARQALGDIKSRLQGLAGSEFLASLLAIATPVFFFQLLLAVLAIIGLTLIAALAGAGWLIAH